MELIFILKEITSKDMVIEIMKYYEFQQYNTLCIISNTISNKISNTISKNKAFYIEIVNRSPNKNVIKFDNITKTLQRITNEYCKVMDEHQRQKEIKIKEHTDMFFEVSSLTHETSLYTKPIKPKKIHKIIIKPKNNKITVIKIIKEFKTVRTYDINEILDGTLIYNINPSCFADIHLLPINYFQTGQYMNIISAFDKLLDRNTIKMIIEYYQNIPIRRKILYVLDLINYVYAPLYIEVFESDVNSIGFARFLLENDILDPSIQIISYDFNGLSINHKNENIYFSIKHIIHNDVEYNPKTRILFNREIIVLVHEINIIRNQAFI